MQPGQKNSSLSVLKITALNLTFLAVAQFHTGCGQSEKDAELPADNKTTHIYQNQEPFKEWIRERHQNIVLVHPPVHPHQDKYEDIARIFSSLARQTCLFFKIEPPDSIIIYFYTGIGNGYSVTQREAPFSDGYVVHFWFPSFYGPPIVKHLLPSWSKEKTRHNFLKNGIVALLDGSGQNYHEVTLNMLDSGTFIPLRRLSEDTTINVDRERIQSAEAASFVDYFVFTYGIDNLMTLYNSKGSFPVDIENIIKIPLSKVEDNWLNFVKASPGNNSSGSNGSSEK